MLKYLKKGSYHTKTAFATIPNEVFNRLANLTSETATNGKLRIGEIYSDHAEALKNAGLVLKTFPP